MAFTSPMTAVTGATFTAAQFNTNVRDNLNAIWVGTTAGDIDYYTGATAKARLAAPAALSLLQHNATAPSWLAKGTALQYLRVKSDLSGFEWSSAGNNAVIATRFSSTSTHSYSSTSERDMPNSSGTISVATQSTVIVIAAVVAACGTSPTTNCWFQYLISIDGTSGAITQLSYSSGIGLPVVTTGIKTGVAAGSRTIKLREKEGYGGGVAYSVIGKEWLALAIPE